MLSSASCVRLARLSKLNSKTYFSVTATQALKFSTSTIHEKEQHKLAQNSFSFNENESFNKTRKLSALIGALGLAAAASYSLINNKVECEQINDEPKLKAGKIVPGLPTYTLADLKSHEKNADSIWVYYKNGVYDITEFVLSHPGGNEKILMAAGGSIEPFWNVFALHHHNFVYEILESLRIGNLEVDEETERLSKEANKNDPWRYDPKRSPLLTVHTQKPFNAETPKELSVENIITPNEIHYVRNHLPVPKIDRENYSLEIVDDISGKTFSFKLDDIQKKFKHHTIPVTLQCSGNKRKFMSDYETVHGLQWDVNAISTAEWTGVKLVDILEYCKLDLNDERLKHVQFEGLDRDPTGSSYGSSIPKEKAFDVNAEVLVAFKMNGVDIPLDNGYPLRIIIPGVVGARSVKWLSKIKLSSEESMSFWQRNDYKVLPTSIKDLKEADFSKLKACQECPVQSAICVPSNGAIIKKDDEKLLIKGYAYSGAGKEIDNVVISVDGGINWQMAELKQIERPYNKSWSWTIWEYEIDIPQENVNGLDIICVATDSAHNTQPEGFKTIWNARGLMNNAWHKIHVDLD